MHLYFVFFSATTDGPTSYNTTSEPLILGQFRSNTGNDSVANNVSITAPFKRAVRGLDVLCNSLNVSRLRW